MHQGFCEQKDGTLWGDKLMGQFEIVIENDTLYAELKDNRQYLHHYHYDTFELIDVDNGNIDKKQLGNASRVTFSTNSAGDIDFMKVDVEPAYLRTRWFQSLAVSKFLQVFI